MTKNYCQNCSQKLMITLRMCHKCGSKDIGSVEPLKRNSTQQTINPANAGTSTNSNNNTSTNVKLGKILNINPAPLGQRFLAFIIDTIAISILTTMPVLMAYLINMPFKEGSNNPLATIAFLASFVAPYIYYTVMHATPYSATLGKRWMNIKIINISGEGLTKMQAFLRILVTLLLPIAGGLAVTLSLGSMAMTYKEAMQDSIILAIVLALPLIFLGPYLLILFNPLKQSLFDILMKTIVVKG